MEANNIIHSEWDPQQQLVVTRIGGNVGMAEIEYWERTLHDALRKIKDGGVFKILVNLHGFKATNFEAHKRFRTIIPVTLALYGWKTGYTGLFEEEAKQLKIILTRNIQCAGAAHCHHDETKISLYEERFSKRNERYFTDPEAARLWITELPLVKPHL